MSIRRITLLASFLLFSLGCGDGSGAEDAGSGTSDAGASDASAADAGNDAGAADAGNDAGGEDAGADDAGVDAGTDAGASDAGMDAGVSDGGSDAGPACSYLDLDIWIADCGSGFTYVRRWTETGGAAGCPDYYTVGGTRYATLADALSMNACDRDCLRAASTSVTLLRCGRRTGYIVYRDAEMDCGELLETPDGLFESQEAWDAAFPCPE